MLKTSRVDLERVQSASRCCRGFLGFKGAALTFGYSETFQGISGVHRFSSELSGVSADSRGGFINFQVR